jgi:hypothetical protein
VAATTTIANAAGSVTAASAVVSARRERKMVKRYET